MMSLLAALCALLAVVLAWPVPTRLAVAAWPSRNPRRGIALWQVIGLSGGISAVGSLLLLGFDPLGPRWTLLNLAALAGAAILLTWLLGVLATNTIRIERQLAKQRDAVDLLAWIDLNGVRVLDHPEPAAYCLPGPRPRIVVTHGAIASLGPEELAAVLAHERAHAVGRHELIIQPFVAWESALPFLPPARRATAAVAELVEMLADDHAARETSPRALARALAQVGSDRLPSTNGDAASASVLPRVRRLVQ
ncbi:M56 family metallopeptidase [Actinospica sp.]|jgi:Zn-dependent protease with chaperone function|uniref:M56 family metallopeptidase n=1 Tax=Actinospica sp. TaxID=1872142 RepID=UPI002B575781|nr:M56 family metallopeptidase [Actinospica sp.]HWG23718.1 M56 family metallopeptidase [Actinospica sp.]